MAQTHLTGGCQCGRLRYEITAEPQSVYTCHCLDCQRLTSSAFSLGVVVPEEGFFVVEVVDVGPEAAPAGRLLSLSPI